MNPPRAGARLAWWLWPLLFCLRAAALDLHGLPPDSLALWVAPVESNQVRLAYRAEVPVNPASTMKLLTSWVALERLGPDFTWRTRLLSSAPVVDGVLHGDLYWVGLGDPHFFASELHTLLDGLRQRGIRHIAGRLLLDGSAYRRQSSADGFDPDGGESFMAPPDPLLTNLNVSWLRFFHDAQGPRVVLDPPLAGVRLDARLRPGTAGTCPDVRRAVHIDVQDAVISVSGALPPSCDGKTAYVQVLPPRPFAAAAFTALWQQAGGSGPQASGEGTAPGDARELAAVDSVPLARLLPEMNKFSSNPMARSLFLTLGRVAPTDGDTVADAERAVRQTLAAHHLADHGLVLENGAGLSRSERLPAALLGEVLRSAARGAYASELMASLPIAGQTGTLHRRFVDLGPRLRLKTGTLNEVAALAGYWQRADGQRLVIVAILNSPQAAALKPAMDLVVRDAIRQYDADGL